MLFVLFLNKNFETMNMMKKLRINLVSAGMMSALFFLVTFWTLGTTLPLLGFLLGILAGCSFSVSPDDNSEMRQNLRRFFSPGNSIIILANLVVFSLLPFFNIPMFMGYNYFTWAIITLSGFLVGFTLYYFVRCVKLVIKPDNPYRLVVV